MLRALIIAPLAAGALAAPAAGGRVLAIPALHVRTHLARSLDRGPVEWWHDENTIAIAGHDVTPVPGFGPHGPFYELHRLHRGNLLRIGRVVYRVRYVLTLKPTEMWVLRWRGAILSSCWPRYSGAYRKVVLARRLTP